MARLLERDPEVERLIAAFHAELVATGQFAESEVISPARAFLLRIGGAAGFERLTFEAQCQISTRDTRVVLWLITSGHARATPEYLARSDVHIGQIAAWVHREFHQRFVARCRARVRPCCDQPPMVGGREGGRGDRYPAGSADP